ncbi:MAG: formylmethanofuran dehydrogenase subunit C [Anaerolineae bacterium]|nr:formylmethanofuran dehydrogenase subunit C [Anaerolineae bacterium]
MIRLALKTRPDLPLEADTIRPDYFAQKTEAEIAKLPVLHGNQFCALGDFFNVRGGASDQLVLEGDLAQVKRIGTGMEYGQITIHGNAGMHLGAGMRAGEIVVFGDAGDWAGAEMCGGKIHIHGNAGHGLGGAYRGSRHGMNRGMILVEGNAGNETGSLMRRGLVAVRGDVGEFAGAFVIAGTLIVFGSLGRRAGAGMKRGTIVAYQQPELLPTFTFDCVYQPLYLRLILQTLQLEGFSIEEEWRTGAYRRYSGDLNALGKGEIFVYDQH